ncbi:serine protease [Streptomyces sp. NPDC048001]|uniref:serine protease n=1 Tax=Streptomyces sp. NPDC048001 TaxID=3365498 RepID=UPI0037211118
MHCGTPAAPARISDTAGRPLATGFAADDLGTVVVGGDALDGHRAVTVRAPDGRSYRAGPDALVPLPEHGLTLVRTEGLALPPVPISTRGTVPPGTYVRLAASGWREARVLDGGGPTLELAMGADARDALRLVGSAGGPVLDAGTGAVLAVLGRPPAHRTTVPARRLLAPPAPRHRSGRAGAAGPGEPEEADPLAALVRRNAACAPAYGRDLNLAAVLLLAATTVPAPPDGGHGPRCTPPAFHGPDTPVRAVVGAPGTGRTARLAALAAERARGPHPDPTLWLRGADTEPGDASLADALARVLRRAGRITAAAEGRPAPAPAAPEDAALLAAAAGRPLLVVLDGPEEMPALPADRFAAWAARSRAWLDGHSARLVLGCGPEHFEEAAARYGAGPRDCATLGPLGAEQARRLRAAWGLPEGALAERDARHPLTLRLLAEVHAALPGPVPGTPGRDEVHAAWLDLVCLRIAVRVAATAAGPRCGGRVRRLAARAAGRVHEAARHCLASGGGLDGTAFETLFPWRDGWAAAVLTEGLLTPAGTGYRFRHQAFGDWIQGSHLDLDAALRTLVHEPPGPGTPDTPVPRHRAGTLVQALLLAARRHGPAALTGRLLGLVRTLGGPTADEPRWWAARLLAETLAGLPDAEPYRQVLDALARHTAATPGDRETFGPGFWDGLALDEETRFALLRTLVPADPPPGRAHGAPRHLDRAAQRLAAAPEDVQPLLCRWFDDDTPLAADPSAAVRPTVAAAAQALLYARRAHAPGPLARVLLDSGHPRARELLAALADDLPTAYCRAVHRAATDPGPRRRAAAASHLAAAAARATAGSDRALLRAAARSLLARGEPAHRAPALDLLVRDPESRGAHLEEALARFLRGGTGPATVLAALDTHPTAVLAAVRARLLAPGAADGAALTAALAAATTPATARPVAALVCEYVDHRPDGAAHAAAYVDHRLEQQPPDRAVLFPLVTRLVRARPPAVRAALAPVLASPGTAASRVLRAELLDVLLHYEQYAARDLEVLEAVLTTAALSCTAADREPADRPFARHLVHRTALLLVRCPLGAARLDRRLEELARRAPSFALALQRWAAADPEEWARVAGPRTWRLLSAGPARMPEPLPTADGGHGSLRPAQSVIENTGSGEERSQCSAGVAWRTSPRTGGAASSPSAPTTGCTAATS